MDTPAVSQSDLPRPAVYVLAGVYVITSLSLFYLVAVLWPTEAPAPLQILLWRFDLAPQVRMIWLVVVASSLGSYIHTVSSFSLYAGVRELDSSWLAWYFLRPAIGASLALIFYFTLRAGLFAGAASDQNINTFGVAALSGMVGMFSKQATSKLGKIFDTIFS